jgi:hypothetical protein
MQRSEIEPYILHRLSIVGWNGDPHFTADAFAAIYAATGGVPRRVNVLASRVLLLGALDQLSEIDADAVQAVIEDMGADSDATLQAVPPSVLDRAEEVPAPAAAQSTPARETLRAELDALGARQPEPSVSLMNEIAALRAEVESLRVEQATITSVDPEALKDCFTLIEERLASLEFRVGEQDTALRRVLTLLVEWVEREQRMGDTPHSAAA